MDFQGLLVKIAKVLDELRIPYAVTGGYAASVWGRLRSTLDIDIVIEVAEPQIDKLKEVLQKKFKLGYVDADRRSFNFIDGQSGLKVDFFVKEKLWQRRPVVINKYNVYFISPEDLILSKLLWQKETGSEQQLRDVEGIIKAGGDKLDYNYLKKEAKKLKVDEILLKFLGRENI